MKFPEIFNEYPASHIKIPTCSKYSLISYTTQTFTKINICQKVPKSLGFSKIMKIYIFFKPQLTSHGKLDCFPISRVKDINDLVNCHWHTHILIDFNKPRAVPPMTGQLKIRMQEVALYVFQAKSILLYLRLKPALSMFASCLLGPPLHCWSTPPTPKLMQGFGQA